MHLTTTPLSRTVLALACVVAVMPYNAGLAADKPIPTTAERQVNRGGHSEIVTAKSGFDEFRRAVEGGVSAWNSISAPTEATDRLQKAYEAARRDPSNRQLEAHFQEALGSELASLYDKMDEFLARQPDITATADLARKQAEAGIESQRRIEQNYRTRASEKKAKGKQVEQQLRQFKKIFMADVANDKPVPKDVEDAIKRLHRMSQSAELSRRLARQAEIDARQQRRGLERQSAVIDETLRGLDARFFAVRSDQRLVGDIAGTEFGRLRTTDTQAAIDALIAVTAAMGPADASPQAIFVARHRIDDLLAGDGEDPAGEEKEQRSADPNIKAIFASLADEPPAEDDGPSDAVAQADTDAAEKR